MTRLKNTEEEKKTGKNHGGRRWEYQTLGGGKKGSQKRKGHSRKTMYRKEQADGVLIPDAVLDRWGPYCTSTNSEKKREKR